MKWQWPLMFCFSVFRESGPIAFHFNFLIFYLICLLFINFASSSIYFICSQASFLSPFSQQLVSFLYMFVRLLVAVQVLTCSVHVICRNM